MAVRAQGAVLNPRLEHLFPVIPAQLLLMFDTISCRHIYVL